MMMRRTGLLRLPSAAFPQLTQQVWHIWLRNHHLCLTVSDCRSSSTSVRKANERFPHGFLRFPAACLLACSKIWMSRWSSIWILRRVSWWHLSSLGETNFASFTPSSDTFTQVEITISRIDVHIRRTDYVPYDCSVHDMCMGKGSMAPWGTNEGQNWFLGTLLIIIVMSFYLIAIQNVSLRLLLKIINWYKICQYIDCQCIN